MPMARSAVARRNDRFGVSGDWVSSRRRGCERFTMEDGISCGGVAAGPAIDALEEVIAVRATG